MSEKHTIKAEPRKRRRREGGRERGRGGMWVGIFCEGRSTTSLEDALKSIVQRE